MSANTQDSKVRAHIERAIAKRESEAASSANGANGAPKSDCSECHEAFPHCDLRRVSNAGSTERVMCVDCIGRARYLRGLALIRSEINGTAGVDQLSG